MAKNVPIKLNPADLLWQSKNGLYTVVLTSDCLHKIQEIAQKAYPNEVGSMLLGHYSFDGYMALITETLPVPKDSCCSKGNFSRGAKGVWNKLLSIFKTSHGKQHYIGEWHSHPNGSPHPSSLDDKILKKIATDIKVGCPEMVLMIIGRRYLQNRDIGMYVYSKTNGRIDLDQIPISK